jgi:DnaD/phage-associated family protein
MEYMKKWLEEYGFDLDVVLEACNRTITNTHKPDFKYTDSILKNWQANEVTSLADITHLDITFQQQKTLTKKTTVKAGSLILKPFKWYIKTSAKNYEEMFGDNLQFMRFWI